MKRERLAQGRLSEQRCKAEEWRALHERNNTFVQLVHHIFWQCINALLSQVFKLLPPGQKPWNHQHSGSFINAT